MILRFFERANRRACNRVVNVPRPNFEFADMLFVFDTCIQDFKGSRGAVFREELVNIVVTKLFTEVHAVDHRCNHFVIGHLQEKLTGKVLALAGLRVKKLPSSSFARSKEPITRRTFPYVGPIPLSASNSSSPFGPVT